MGPKKNNQKMSIGDFLSDQSLGSWADEMESQPMPAASSSGFGGDRRAFSSASGFGADRGDRFGDRGGFGGGFAGGAERRPFREELPLPSRPPYTAHLGNLSFEVTQGDVQDFLAGCEVTSVRIVEDKLDQRPKGFGYVEFATLDGLKKALGLSETQFQGRNIRISVADPPKDREPTRELNDWSRKGPLPDLPGQGMRRSSERAPSFRGGPEADQDAGGGRRGFFEGDGRSRDLGNWERKGPLTPAPGQEPRQGGRAPRDFGSVRERRQSPGSGEGRSDAGSRPPRREFADRPAVERAPTAADMDNQWRSRMKPDVSPAPTPEASTPSSPAAPAAPASRPRLNLAKRTVSEAPQGDQAGAADSKASPFGAARPIDTRAREQAIEEKRQVALKQKREADDKAKEERKARDAASKAERAASTATTSEPKDSDNQSPRENGRAERKETDRKDSEATSPAPGRQYEILRRMNNGEDASDEQPDRDGPDADANGEIVGDKETKPQEVTREIPVGGDAGKASGGDTTAQELEDDGFTVVGAEKKKGRRGGAQRALAS